MTDISATPEKGFEIIEDDFKMVFDGSYSFDLYFKTPKGAWKLQGYNVPFKNCLTKIIYNRISMKYDEISIKKFFEEYKQMCSELKELLSDGGNP